MKQSILTVFAKSLRITFVTGLLIIMPGCGNTTCDNFLLQEYPSPDNTLRAVTYIRDCGATTDFSTQVSLITDIKDVQNKAGNVLIADANHGAAPTNDDGALDIKINWLSNNELEISYHEKARIFKQKEKVGAITIKYVLFQ